MYAEPMERRAGGILGQTTGFLPLQSLDLKPCANNPILQAVISQDTLSHPMQVRHSPRKAAELTSHEMQNYPFTLKRPKHDQVESGFFKTNQTHLGDLGTVSEIFCGNRKNKTQIPTFFFKRSSSSL
jgi:hypothetical protein